MVPGGEGRCQLWSQRAPLFVPAGLRGAHAPSNRLHLGFIGVGGHGFGYNLKNFLNQDDCRAVAVCDVFQDRTEKAAAAVDEKYADRGCKQVGDFREILQRKYRPEESKHWPLPSGEHRNFLDAIRNRTPPTYTAETLHRLCTPLHAGLIAMDLGRPLRWDPKKEEFIGDAEANRRTTRTRRDDWQRG
jgi:predicted dehydrogenase